MSTDPEAMPSLAGEPRLETVRAASPKSVGGQLTAEELIALNEEIAGMAKAGLPLDQGLAVLAREMGRGRLQQVTDQLASDLRAGFTLPQALERQGRRLPPYYAALLAAGIRSNRIGAVLGTLTLYARSLADFRSTVITALLYPSIVLFLGLGLLVLVAVVVLPGFDEIFREFRLQLPLATRVLLYIGRHPLGTLIVPLLIVVGGLVAAYLLFQVTRGGRMLWARFVYSLPVVGGLVRSARLAAFTDLLGILVDQSIPLPEALSLAGTASSDPLLLEGVERVEKDLRLGMPLGQALEQHGLVPELVIWMTHFGEKQGTLGTTLHHLAEMYRRQAELRAAFLRTILPPLMILVLAAVLAGMFLFGLMLPMNHLLDGMAGVKL